MDILDDMGVSKLSARFFLEVNYSFNDCFSKWSDLPQCQTLSSPFGGKYDLLSAL